MHLECFLTSLVNGPIIAKGVMNFDGVYMKMVNSLYTLCIERYTNERCQSKIIKYLENRIPLKIFLLDIFMGNHTKDELVKRNWHGSTNMYLSS
jgi:hypothetical protein